MRSPMQAAPVARGAGRYRQPAAVAQSGCNILACGTAVASCLAVCIGAPASPACIACLGPAYSSCKDCLPF